MPQSQTMTLDEKLAISNRACSLLDAGDKKEADRLIKTMPMPSYLARVLKETMGAEFLLNGGWNLSEAEAELGPDFLNK